MVRPILFNTDMVRAILDDRKTATRRLVRFLPGENPNWTGYVKDGLMLYNGKNEPCCRKPPYQLGDILYVRETWAFATCINCNGDYRRKGVPVNCYDYQAVKYDDGDSISDGCFLYRADCENQERITWRPSIHMPKQAARIWLKVTDVRVERLHDMTLDDFLAEGVVLRPTAFNDPANAYLQARDIFQNIWDSTIPKAKLSQNGWDANPWVWVIEFERCKKLEGTI